MNEPFENTHQQSYLQIKKWSNDNLIAGITTRIGGKSQSPFNSLNMGWHVNDSEDSVAKNYSLIEKELDFPLLNWASSKQVHGTNILRIHQGDATSGQLSPPNFTTECDGFITNEPNILLTAVFADCVPLFFYSPKENLIGLAHAGWRGTVKGIGRKMVHEFIDSGANLKDIKVAIGPSISSMHYEVDDYVVSNIPIAYHKPPIIFQKDDDHYDLDLNQLHKEIFLEEGLLEENILVSSYCTYSEEELFFSYRRDKGQTGRMMAFIGMKEK
jgi:polyphenol oxidase